MPKLKNKTALAKVQPGKIPSTKTLSTKTSITERRKYTDAFRRDAVQMLLDGHSATSIAERLGIRTNLIYRWKKTFVQQAGPVGSTLDSRVQELESELLRVERERDILKKALIIFGRSG
jgi:transposase